MSGRFITLEGGEGTGKSTQMKRLVKTLEAHDASCVATREPGGSPGAEEIRKLLVTGEPGRWDALTEMLLLFAARADHVARTIQPALDAGKYVICDRFTDSTYAYQGVGRARRAKLSGGSNPLYWTTSSPTSRSFSIFRSKRAYCAHWRAAAMNRGMRNST
ncbi:MAG: dTMP kinase [Rhizomicrobium sp.]